MTTRPWMPLYVPDYLADTGHLSTAEHGAYLLLIMHYWQNDGLPTDDKKLARIARLSPDEWADIRDTIADLFDSNWHHKRIDAELAKATEVMSKRRAAGKAGAKARYGGVIANAKQVPKQAHRPSPSPSHTAASAAEPRRDFLDRLEAECRDAAGLTDDSSSGLCDLSPLTALLDAGYDLRTDILPKLRAGKAKGAKPRSWQYFVPAITEANEKRAAIPKQERAEPHSEIQVSHGLYRDLAERYEREKGKPPIALPSKADSGVKASMFPDKWIAEARATMPPIPESLKRPAA